MSKSQGGSIRWCVPEQLKQGGRSTRASDIYSCGMVLWEILTRKIPYENATDVGIVMGCILSGQKEEIPSTCPYTYGSLINRCWSDPQSRPNAAELNQLVRKGLEEVNTEGNNSPIKVCKTIAIS